MVKMLSLKKTIVMIGMNLMNTLPLSIYMKKAYPFVLKQKKQEMITIGDYVDGKPVFEAPEAHGTWVSVDDELPSISDQYWVAYNAIHYENKDEELEFDYCTAHFNTDEKQWYIKDQLFYKQRQCKVVYWQPLPELPKQT